MPDRGTRRARVALLGLLAVVLVAAAATGAALRRDPPRSGPAEPVPATRTVVAEPVPIDLTATLELPRLVHEPRTVAVRVTNHADGPVRVREVALRTGSFETTGPVEKDVLIRAGGAKALTVQYGDAVCGGAADPPVEPVTAQIVVAGSEAPAAGDWQRRELALPGAEERLTTRLHAECAARLVARAAEFRLEGWSEQADGQLRGLLVVERRAGDQPILVHRLTGSVLYTLTPESSGTDELLGELPPGQARLEIPVRADAARCDPHAKADAKQPFRFQAWASVGADRELPTLVATEQSGRDRLDQAWDVWCDA